MMKTTSLWKVQKTIDFFGFKNVLLLFSRLHAKFHKKLINVLFVCLGNICRSPIAEAVFRQLVKDEGLENQIACDSAGTAAYHSGCLPDKRMRIVAREKGLQLTHAARQISEKDFLNFDYILAMDQANFNSIRAESYRVNGTYPSERQLYLYRQFDTDRGESLDVPDPYYHEMDAFLNVYEITKRSGEHFLKWLVRAHSLESSVG